MHTMHYLLLLHTMPVVQIVRSGFADYYAAFAVSMKRHNEWAALLPFACIPAILAPYESCSLAL